LGIYISTHCTNEEAASAFQLGAQLRATRYFVGGQPPGKFRRVPHPARQEPNTNGLRLVAEAFGTKLEDLSSMDGVKALVAFRTDGLPADKLGRFELIVAIAQNDDCGGGRGGRDLALPERLRAGRLAGELVRPPAAPPGRRRLPSAATRRQPGPGPSGFSAGWAVRAHRTAAAAFRSWRRSRLISWDCRSTSCPRRAS